MIIRELENADSVIMVMNGECEVYSVFEGNEFVIERL
jgi:hypothetical protein